MANMVRKMTLFKEKLSSKSKSSEPSEFNEKFENVLKARQELKEVRSAMKKWNSQMQHLISSGKTLGKLINTDELSRTQHLEALKNASPPEYYGSVNKKIDLLDSVVKNRKALEEARLMRQHHAKKLSDYERKHPESPELEKLAAKLAAAQKEYDDKFEDVKVAVEYTSSSYVRGGLAGLLNWELDAFHMAQSHLFSNLKGVISPYSRGPVNGAIASDQPQSVQGDFAAEFPHEGSGDEKSQKRLSRRSSRRKSSQRGGQGVDDSSDEEGW